MHVWDFVRTVWAGLLGWQAPESLKAVDFPVVLISPGTFLMGSPEDEPRRWHWENLRQVTLTRSFLMQATEVTRAQWRGVMGRDPKGLAADGCDTCPVAMVSWYSALAYANALSVREGLPEAYVLEGCHGRAGDADFSCETVRPTAASPYETLGWRLPTEAEWEYACRAGATTAWAHGSDVSVLGEVAWYRDNSSQRSHPVGSLRPNAWGLYDMSGNVGEMCWDGFVLEPSGTVTDPVDEGLVTARVLRGGAWPNYWYDTRAALRLPWTLEQREPFVGFRLVRKMR